MKSGAVPILRYQNAKQAIQWLCDSLGFCVLLEVPSSDVDVVNHARLVLQDNMVMLGSLGREGKIESYFKPPEGVGGVTQCVSLYVNNPRDIYEKAIKAGVEILEELSEFPFGGESFSCRDLESHIWIISSHNPWAQFE